MFTEAIHELFKVQKQRMLAAAPEERITTVFEFLDRRGLDPDSIDRACCEELKRVLTHRYESSFATSGRLGGRGWGQGHVASHMERFLKNKLKNASAVMRAAVCTEDDLTEDYMLDLLATEPGGTASPKPARRHAESEGAEPAESYEVADAESEGAESEGAESEDAEAAEEFASGPPRHGATKLASSLDDLTFE
jgi:hypothetical protein